MTAALTTLVLFLGLAPLVSTPAQGAAYTLYGSFPGGWGFSPLTITNPGPQLTVTAGERVDLTLYAADSSTHTWCIDYDGDNGCAATGENESGPFSSPTVPYVWSFVPIAAPGLYNYVCGLHGSAMKGQIEIQPAVRPAVSISSPTGSQSWTGGSTHDVVWTMTDPNDPVTALVAYVNYTDGATVVPIAGPVPGLANPHRVTWTLPRVNSTTATVNVTVIDPAGNKGWARQLVPRIDSAPPSVIGRIPTNGASGISTATNVIATFDEAMDTAATAAPDAAAIQDTVTLGWVPVTYSWSALNTVLTLNPVTNLAPNWMYRAIVNQSAEDASDPGNPLSTVAMWTFTTGSGADVVKPEILGVAANPAVQEYGLATNLTASITDNDGVASAWVNVTYPDNSRTNRSMAFAGGTTWFRADVFPQLGNYLFNVAAVDPSGNWNRSGSGSFRVVDTTAPVIGSPAVTSSAEVYGPVNVSVTASDPFLASVGIDIAGVLNESMAFDAGGGRWFKVFTPTQVRAYTFVVSATDTSGNRATRSGSFDVADTTPPPVPQNVQTQVAVGNAGIELTWEPVSTQDLAGYNVYRDTSPTGTFATKVASATAGTTFRDTTVQAGVTYYYRVTAVDLRDLESNPSNIASAALPVPPVDYVPYAIAGILIVVVAAALGAFLLLRRRRRKGA